MAEFMFENHRAQTYCGTRIHVNAHKDTFSSACTKALWSGQVWLCMEMHSRAKIHSVSIKRHWDTLLPHLHWERQRERQVCRTGSVWMCACFCKSSIVGVHLILSCIIFRAFVAPQPLALSVPLDGPPDPAEDSTPEGKKGYHDWVSNTQSSLSVIV